ncbi:MAG: ABC transporter ATP-binding protein [Butyricicoccus pullicaecorum]|nr:ABC transporter ATP-binding protein [Butyricicoccus pullicaecorum]
MHEIIRFEHVSYTYDDGRQALSDLSATFSRGEKVAILGENGAGKSTFFLLCNGVLRPTNGQIFLEGKPVSTKRQSLNELRRNVGFVFQDPDVQLLAGTVEEEISFGPMNLGWSEDLVQAQVDAAIHNLHLDTFRMRAPQYLSGGEKKRVSIADVLAMSPQLILLDEPASSLDPSNARLLEENLSTLESRGISLLIATHDVDFAWRWADRVLLFHEGRLLADTTPESAFSDTSLLAACGLTQPILYEVSKILNLSQPIRTLEALRMAVEKKGRT